MADTISLREKHMRRIAATLQFVADHIDRYMPDEVLLEGSEFVVRIPDTTEIPTVEVDARMPAQIIFDRT